MDAFFLVVADSIYNASTRYIYRWCVAYITMLHFLLKSYSPSGRNYTNKAFQATEARLIFIRVILKCWVLTFGVLSHREDLLSVLKVQFKIKSTFC